MISTTHVVTAARLVRIVAGTFAVTLLVGFVAVSSFVSQYGSSSQMTLDATSSDTALTDAISQQESSGLTCSEEPTLTDVILFQAKGASEVTVLTFDGAIRASSAHEGWIRRYCVKT